MSYDVQERHLTWDGNNKWKDVETNPCYYNKRDARARAIKLVTERILSRYAEYGNYQVRVREQLFKGDGTSRRRVLYTHEQLVEFALARREKNGENVQRERLEQGVGRRVRGRPSERLRASARARVLEIMNRIVPRKKAIKGKLVPRKKPKAPMKWPEVLKRIHKDTDGYLKHYVRYIGEDDGLLNGAVYEARLGYPYKIDGEGLVLIKGQPGDEHNLLAGYSWDYVRRNVLQFLEKWEPKVGDHIYTYKDQSMLAKKEKSQWRTRSRLTNFPTDANEYVFMENDYAGSTNTLMGEIDGTDSYPPVLGMRPALYRKPKPQPAPVDRWDEI